MSRILIVVLGALIGLVASGCKTLGRPPTQCRATSDCFANEVCCEDTCVKASSCTVDDAGGDAGADSDAGAVADAGSVADAGTDAGADAGIDAGPPLTCTTPYRFDLVDASVVDTSDIALAIDSERADITAAWLRATGPSTRTVVAAKYVADLGWGTPVALSPASAIATKPTLGRDDAGNTIVAWIQNDGISKLAMCRNYFPDAGVASRWTDAGILDDDGSPNFPRVAVDPSGYAVVVFEKNSPREVWATAYGALSDTWKTPVKVSVGLPGVNDSPDVALDGQGRATTIWRNYDAGYSLWASRWDRTTAWDAGCWTPPVEIGRYDAGVTGLIGTPSVTASLSGAVTAYWRQLVTADTTYVFANRLIPPASTWTGVIRVDTHDGGAPWNPFGAQVEADTAFAAWQWSDGVRDAAHVAIMRSGNWQAPTRVSTGIDYANQPRVSTNAAGMAVVAWQQWDGGAYSIWVTGGNAEGAWKSPTLVATHPDAGLGRPEVALAADGYALIIWAGETSGIRTMWSSVCH